ncbi:TrkA family potassium uptake protein [Brevibacterium litoralis]|uniref:TrkA family potassium uptake protein n=1 Tax=Brevibacterium litoralis TaxID=3138935 RepID=UPI0032EC67DF
MSGSWWGRAGSFFIGEADRLAAGGAVAVIGLGRFGGALARELSRIGVDVIGIDAAEAVVDEYRDVLAFTARGDATDEDMLRQLGVHEADIAVVCIGSDLEASILAVSRLLKFGGGAPMKGAPVTGVRTTGTEGTGKRAAGKGPRIWAKAISEPHAEILTQMGVSHLVRPERDMGTRLAHLLRSHLHDFVGIDEDFAVARMAVPAHAVEWTPRKLAVREKYGVTVVAVRRGRPEDTQVIGDDDGGLGGSWRLVDDETTLYYEDEILLAGPPSGLESFADR